MSTAAAPGGGFTYPGTVPATGKVNRNRAWRSALAAPAGFWLGSLLILIGSALQLGRQTRAGFFFTGGLYTAGTILYIIAFAIWTVGSLVHLVAAMGEAAMVRTTVGTPGIGRLLVLSAFFQLIGAILLLIGACIFLAANSDNFKDASAGAILWLEGELCPGAHHHDRPSIVAYPSFPH
jgi:hypothetical protein